MRDSAFQVEPTHLEILILKIVTTKIVIPAMNLNYDFFESMSP
jgi:hypothetical protein